MYKIFSLKKYYVKQDTIENKSFVDIDEISEVIETENKGYHLKLFSDEDYIIFGDVDHITKHEEFKFILENLSIYFNIDVNEINFTKSKKENELSYHWTINKLYSKLENMKEIMKEFKIKYPKIEKFIDLSVYKIINWFRLPYQTNEDKPYEHIIKKGITKNFILNYINDAQEYKFIKIQPEIIKEKEIIQIKPTENHQENKPEIINNELEKIKSYFIFLSIERVNKYDEWFKLGCLIKSLYYENGLNLFLELSRKSKFYETDEYIINTYNKISKLNFKINTFYFLLKQDNPKEYYKLVKDNFKKLDDISIDKIKINSEYLSDIDDELNKPTILNENIHNFFNSDIKTLSIKSAYDTGKTQLLKKIIRKYEPVKILMLSYRITLSQDLTGNFKDEFKFCNYIEDKNYKTCDRVIIQLESLLKLRNEVLFFDENEINYEIPSYDLIIIDEIESILNQFNSPTFKGKNKDTFEFLTEIINNSKKLICLDGDINERAYNYIKNFGPSINIENDYKKNIKIFNIIDKNEEFNKYILNSLGKNEKIALVSQSRTKADEYYQLIKNFNDTLNILLYTSMTDDEEKIKLKNVNEIWSNCDVLIYSPTVEAGVNFDKLHFNKIYGIFGNNSTSPRSFLQMLARIRKTTDNEIIINNSTSNFKINDECELYNFSQVKHNAAYLKCFEKSGRYVLNSNGKKIYRVCFDAYTTNYIYNYMEILNKQHFYFLTNFKELILSKGHQLIFNKFIDKNDDEDEYNEEFSFNYEIIKTPSDKIYDADNITQAEYNQIKIKKQNNKATEEDKTKADKYFLMKELGNDKIINKITVDIIDKWKNKIYTIANYNFMVDINKYKRDNTADNILYYEKLLFTKKLIETLNLKLDDKSKFINSEELKNNFITFFKNENIENKIKAYKMFYKFDINSLDDKTNNKQIIGTINSILSNYSLKLENKQIRLNKKREYVYFLVSSDNEILNINYRKLKLKLNNEIRKTQLFRKLNTDKINTCNLDVISTEPTYNNIIENKNVVENLILPITTKENINNDNLKKNMAFDNYDTKFKFVRDINGNITCIGEHFQII